MSTDFWFFDGFKNAVFFGLIDSLDKKINPQEDDISDCFNCYPERYETDGLRFKDENGVVRAANFRLQVEFQKKDIFKVQLEKDGVELCLYQDSFGVENYNDYLDFQEQLANEIKKLLK